jgi:hypothetical protein
LLVVAPDVVGVVGTELNDGISVADPVLIGFIAFVTALLSINIRINIGHFVGAIGKKTDGSPRCRYSQEYGDAQRDTACDVEHSAHLFLLRIDKSINM